MLMSAKNPSTNYNFGKKQVYLNIFAKFQFISANTSATIPFNVNHMSTSKKLLLG